MASTAPDGRPARLHHVHRGSGPQLLAIHGLGGNWRSWEPMLDDLAAEREVIAFDLPGFGETPTLREVQDPLGSHPGGRQFKPGPFRRLG
jgi:pimeloyl-ACP methyl ester carboxylesterase